MILASERKTETTAIQKDGKLRIWDREKFWQSVFALGDGEFKIIIQKVYRKRTLKQNKYYWKIIIEYFLQGYEKQNGRPLSLEVASPLTGEIVYFPLSKDERSKKAHEILKEFFNVDDEGNIKSTTANTTVEQENYYTYCREFIEGFYGVRVPLPREQLEIEYNEENH